MLCTPSPVDPSENVTLMNLRPKTGYNVRVQLSRPGEGGEGAWGPPTLMTTDCPGERPRVIPSCPPRGYCPVHSGVIMSCPPQGPLPFPLEVVLPYPLGITVPSRPKYHWAILTPDLWPQSPCCSHGWIAGMWRALTGCE